jgi:NAD(P)-dependent dehydrogenase (short-subunit alcohol dehydrogenase family)/rhamnose utilization protein RhaD (predicted bifunctional aldolase and dehydrogenase)
MEALKALATVSRDYAKRGGYVFLGGGNTSFKDDTTLYIKPSGVELAGIRAEQFVRMDRTALRELFSGSLPEAVWDREAAVKDIMASAVRPLGSARASVEAPVHEVIDAAFVVHLHPVLVNGMACASGGREACARLFPDALWLNYCNPGATLAFVVKQALEEAKRSSGTQPRVIVLQNHGVFVGADSLADVQSLYTNLTETLLKAYAEAGIPPQLPQIATDQDILMKCAPPLRTILGDGPARAIISTEAPFAPAEGPLTPDHIVYAKSFPLCSETPAEPAATAEYEKDHGQTPGIVCVPGKAVFCAGASLKDARARAVAARDAALVQQLTHAFGGPRFLTPEEFGFIENWEVESYRRKVSAADADAGRIANRVCVVTGAAQGFGLGIARELAAAGGIVVIADLNQDGAREAAEELNRDFGPHTALWAPVNIADESSVRDMVCRVTEACGGIDLFVANAGVLKAGSVKDMTLKDWSFVTSVNYTGYFLCVKHAAPVMAAQTVNPTSPWSDIVQINSKSGLEGSNKNGAYAGSKFGTIGLTQSFAKELVVDRIKVNSICPGNFFDGPLWSDPDHGLFVQYLRTGKVPGAKTVEDVRKAYEEKVPMARGCTPTDVTRAILYCVEQQYETGQAIPVTGGQVMLH